MNLPISLTLLRIFFVPIVVVLLLTKGGNMDLWAVGVFLLAAVTDLLDGYLARKRGQITTLGILLDPIADKLLTFGRLYFLGGTPPGARVDGGDHRGKGIRRFRLAFDCFRRRDMCWKPSELGKTKMVFQVVAITVIILEGRRFQALHPLGEVLLWVVVLFAVASAVQYFWSFWKRLDERVKHRASRRVVVMEADEKEPEEKDVAAH